MSKRDEGFERWLRDAARSPGLEGLRDRLESSEPLPDDVLARYQAGMLSPEEEALVEREIALAPGNLERLARIEQELEDAANDVMPRVSIWQRLSERLSGLLGGALAPGPANLAWGGAAAMVLVAAFFGYQMIVGPPGIPSVYFAQNQLRGGPETVAVDWGEPIPRVDTSWPLARPVGTTDDTRWFLWSPFDGAASYGLRLHDVEGELLFERSGLADPRVELPAEVRSRLEPGEEYVWIVRATFAPPVEPIHAIGRFRLQD